MVRLICAARRSRVPRSGQRVEQAVSADRNGRDAPGASGMSHVTDLRVQTPVAIIPLLCLDSRDHDMLPRFDARLSPLPQDLQRKELAAG